MSIAIAAMMLTGACGGKKVRAAKPVRIGSTETGVASWYGHPYHGRRAANGEIYDMEKFTAAHRTFPFGTWVRVKNLTNDRAVEVRIQDRGPFVNGRIIDLSRAAARDIALLGPGLAKVKLTVIKPPKHEPVPMVAARAGELPASARPETIPAAPVDLELFAAQVGAFQDKTRAEALTASMRQQYGTARIVLREATPPMWRVLVGEKETVEEAEALAAAIRSAGGAAFVVRIDKE